MAPQYICWIQKPLPFLISQIPNDQPVFLLFRVATVLVVFLLRSTIQEVGMWMSAVGVEVTFLLSASFLIVHLDFENLLCRNLNLFYPHPFPPRQGILKSEIECFSFSFPPKRITAVNSNLFKLIINKSCKHKEWFSYLHLGHNNPIVFFSLFEGFPNLLHLVQLLESDQRWWDSGIVRPFLPPGLVKDETDLEILQGGHNGPQC